MSWDIVIFNSSQKINSPEEVNEDQLIPISFSSVFEGYFKTATKNSAHLEIKGNDFIIDYFSSDEPSSNILLSLHGANAIYPLIDLAIKNNWQIFDTGLGEMLDLNNPSKNGYQNFQVYLKQILNNQN